MPVGRAFEVKGVAWDGGRGIASVDVSADGGRSWRSATLGTDYGRFSFRSFSQAFTPTRARRADGHGARDQPRRRDADDAS